MYLERIESPDDVRALPSSALPGLCDEIRRAVISSSAAVGGHLGSNLAVVELTVALHRVFKSPRDKIVFDVSHQTYAHKMLTGRARAFTDPERYGRVS
ncbi:MAG TPA: 1-deoxy-D-xylulose-5-phosphate synthase, partial [Candidatus Olsenella avistercoris]|nr:1-deoxy-D-xylulose-5-phosphate synthase [Candidatus Olsenella avistercoris]